MHVSVLACLCVCVCARALVLGPGARALQLVRSTKPLCGHIRTRKVWGKFKNCEEVDKKK